MSRPAAGTQLPVPVTQDHIDKGLPEEACDCAVALAITDAVRSQGLVPEVDSVSVIYGDFADPASSVAATARVWIQPGSWLRLALGAECARFMWLVDTGQPVHPITLNAEVC